MDPLLVINLIDRLLDLAGRIGNTEELEEYIELRKGVRKAKVALANSLGSEQVAPPSPAPSLNVSEVKTPLETAIDEIASEVNTESDDEAPSSQE